MGAMRTLVVVAAASCVSVLAGTGGAARADAEPVVDTRELDTAEVLLREPGDGFELTTEERGAAGMLTRTFEGPGVQLIAVGIPITDPPGVTQMFEVYSRPSFGLEPVPEPTLGLATWLVPESGTPGDDGAAILAFASRRHIFVFSLLPDATRGEANPVDPVAFVRDLARGQLDRAGSGPAAASTERDRSADEAVVALLPDRGPVGFDATEPVTVVGSDELRVTDQVEADVVDFLNRRSATATRVWADATGGLLLAVGVTQFPYDIFAAASLGSFADGTDIEVVPAPALDDIDDVVAFVTVGEGGGGGQVGAAFRRGDVFVVVLSQRDDDVPVERAVLAVIEGTRLAVGAVPPGPSSPYRFPEPPTQLAGLAVTGAIVTTAVAGSAAIARLRARRVRRSWAELTPDPTGPNPTPGTPPSGAAVIPLDADAARLRRSGRGVVIGQLVAVNVCIVALAGDFGSDGVLVATVALLAGLAFSRWWLERELGLLGAVAPPRRFVLPRFWGAVMGIVSLSVLGIGVGYLLKGVRYLVMSPTLAQLRWSDILGVAPRTVSVVFALGGLVVAGIGAMLFRIARALGRERAQEVRESDPRPPALYLRSFEDDVLPLPIIASARRPMFELLSTRGADPFEEAVAWELGTYGPVVAVGRPGRSLASLGAAREHLPDDTWQDEVASRMRDAAVIVVATGSTDGLAWELAEVVRAGHIAKSVLVFPPLPPSVLARRWAHTETALTDAGVPVGELPAPPGSIHTVTISPNGNVRATVASRRDEATYRTAIDHAVEPLMLATPTGPPHPATT